MPKQVLMADHPAMDAVVDLIRQEIRDNGYTEVEVKIEGQLESDGSISVKAEVEKEHKHKLNLVGTPAPPTNVGKG